MCERKDKWTVGQWMTPDPVTIPPDLSVRAAFIKMKREGYRHLLVVKDGNLLGIVSDRNLRQPDLPGNPERIDEFYRLEDDYEVRYIMTIPVKTVTPGDRLEEALQIFVDHKYGALPVLDKNEKVIGILTIHDAMRAFAESLKKTGDILRQE